MDKVQQTLHILAALETTMFTLGSLFKTRPLHVPTVLAWAVAVVVATWLAQTLSGVPAWQFDSAVHLASSLALVIGLGWTLFQLVLNRDTPSDRSRWILAFIAMAVIGAIQATDWLVGSGFMADDWLIDLPFWLVASAMVFLVVRHGHEQPAAMSLWRLGLAMQLVFIVCDLWEGKSSETWSLSADGLASIAGWSRLLAIESYVVALILVGGTAGTDRILSALCRLPDGSNDMTDRVLFAVRCRQEGLAVPQTLLESGGGKEGLTWQVSRDALDRDLFCKPRSGRNALGNFVFRRIGPNLYEDPEGDEIDLDTVVAWVDAYSRTTPVIVQPRLRNHPELADLADRSLVTVRLLTCLDSESRPVLTHALLRIQAEIEPRWHRNDVCGIPIDLDSGRLGAMTSDRIASFAKAFRHHPVTERVVEGRVIRSWPAIRALALDAHRAFPQRIIVGWDIAMTDEGPVLLEGNVSPEVMFSRSDRRKSIGLSPLGPLLRKHLSALREQRDTD